MLNDKLNYDNNINIIIEKLKLNIIDDTIIDMCAICKEDIIDNLNIKLLKLNCGHIYCLPCLIKWICASVQYEEQLCPYCKKIIVWNKSFVKI